eukprot:353938-Chlamydomonas_euryale.AAC.1
MWKPALTLTTLATTGSPVHARPATSPQRCRFALSCLPSQTSSLACPHKPPLLPALANLLFCLPLQTSSPACPRKPPLLPALANLLSCLPSQTSSPACPRKPPLLPARANLLSCLPHSPIRAHPINPSCNNLTHRHPTRNNPAMQSQRMPHTSSGSPVPHLDHPPVHPPHPLPKQTHTKNPCTSTLHTLSHLHGPHPVTPARFTPCHTRTGHTLSHLHGPHLEPLVHQRGPHPLTPARATPRHAQHVHAHTLAQAGFQRGPATSFKLATDPYLRVIGARDVMALGDCSSVQGREDTLPPTAQVAAQQGAYVAHMLNRGYVLGVGGLEEMAPRRLAPTGVTKGLVEVRSPSRRSFWWPSSSCSLVFATAILMPPTPPLATLSLL